MSSVGDRNIKITGAKNGFKDTRIQYSITYSTDPVCYCCSATRCWDVKSQPHIYQHLQWIVSENALLKFRYLEFWDNFILSARISTVSVIIVVLLWQQALEKAKMRLQKTIKSSTPQTLLLCWSYSWVRGHGLGQARASYVPGATCGPEKCLIGPADLQEIWNSVSLIFPAIVTLSH